MPRRSANVFKCFVVALCLVAVLTVEEVDSQGNACGLLQPNDDQVAGGARTTWHVADAFLDEYGLQDAIDCARDGDVIWISASSTLRPPKPLNITKRLTIRHGQSDEARTETEDDTRTTLTCPSNDRLLLIECVFRTRHHTASGLGVSRNASVVLEDIVIRDCSFVEDDSVDSIIDVKCDAASDEAFVFELSNVDFVNNTNLGGSVGFSVRNQNCVSVSMDGVVFSANRFLHGSLFGQKNELKNIHLSENVQIWSGSANDGQDVTNQYTMKQQKGQKHMQNSLRFAENPALYALFRFPKSSTATLVNVIAEKNKGELISVEEARLTMEGRTSFHHNVLDIAGSAMIIAYESAVHLSGVSFQSNEYRKQSSGFSLYQGSNGTLDRVHFVNNTIDSGFFVAATHVGELHIHSSNFEENTAKNGSVVFVSGTCDDRDPLLNISNTRFSRNGEVPSFSAQHLGIQLLISGFDSGRVLLHSTTFSLNEIKWYISRYILDFFQYFVGGSLLMRSSEHVEFTMTNCTFYKNHFPLELPEMHFVNCGGDFIISKSRFLENIGVGTGRVILFNDTMGKRSDLRIADSLFRGNSGDVKNVYIVGAKSVRVERSNFTDNTAHLEGFGLFVDNADSFEAHDCQILNNYMHWKRISGRVLYAPRSGAFLFHTVHSVVIKTSVFYNNSGGVGAAVRYEPQSDKSKLLVESCTFQKNSARADGGAFYTYSCMHVTVRNSSFIENSSEHTSGGLCIGGSDRMNVEFCTFQKNKAKTAGGLFVGSYERVWVANSTFHGNSAETFGGALRVDDGRSAVHKAYIRDVNFTENTAMIGGAISSSESTIFTLHECSFVRNKATLYGGAVALMKMPGPTDHFLKYMHLGRLSFVENRAAYGGGLFIDTGEKTVKPDDKNNVAMPKAEMRNFPKDVDLGIGIMTFSDNHAEIAGGAVFIQYRDYIDHFKMKCTLAVNTSSSAVYSKISSLPAAECEHMEGNTVKDGGYGPNIATPSTGFFATISFQNETNDSLAEGDSGDLGAWKSGDELPLMEIVVYDSFGQRLARTRSPSAEAVSLSPGQPPVTSYGFPITALLHSEDSLFQNDLVCDLTDGQGILVMGSPLVEPGSYSAKLGVHGLSDRDITLTVTARECVINEYQRDDNKECIECDHRHYNFNPTDGSCTICPENANCTGMYVLPDPGKWNSFPCSHEIHLCLYEDACLGIEEDNFRQEGLHVDEEKKDTCDFSDEAIEKYRKAMCDDGYEGVLCGACNENYAKIGLSRCRECQNRFLIVLGIAVTMVLLTYSSTEQIGGNLDNVRSRWVSRLERLRTTPTEAAILEVINRAEADKEHVEVAQKAKERFVLVLQIMLNFLQSISAAMSMDFKWSPYIVQLLTTWNWISGTMSDVSTFSFECLLPARGSTPGSIIQTALTVIVPLSVTAAICSFWAIRTVSRRMPWKFFVKRCILTAVSVLYISYLSLAETAINVFYCIDVFDEVTLGGVNTSHSYWVADTSVTCYAGSHRVLAYVVAVPLLVFVIVYPLVLAVVMAIAHKRGKLRSDWIQSTLGVLMNGFKTEFAFWDCTILLRKALIAAVVVFAYKFDVALQATLMTAIFVCSMYLHLVFLPYQTNAGPLNFLEGLSLFVCGTTVMSGVILTDPHTTSEIVKFTVVLFVFASNLIAFSIFGYHLLTNKYTEIKYTLLCEGVDVGNGDVAAVLKAYVRHKTEKVRNLSRKITEKMAPSRRKMAAVDAAGSESTRSLLPCDSTN